MAQPVQEVGRKVLKGTAGEQTAGYTPFSIDAAVALSSKLPATATQSVGNIAASSGTVPKHKSGILEATLVVEGTNTCRYRKDNVAPTAAVGHLTLAPTATTPITIVVRGADEIAGFQIIGTAAGNVATVSFDVADV